MNGEVLIVDDDATTGRLMTLLVRKMGHRAFWVDSGDKALEFLAHNLPNVVILDLMMPGMDGMEVLRRMRGDPTTAQVPVVMFSALADRRYSDEARLQGANDYWVKATVDFRSLGTRLQNYLPVLDQPQN